jgi:hypothetical protein
MKAVPRVAEVEHLDPSDALTLEDGRELGRVVAGLVHLLAVGMRVAKDPYAQNARRFRHREVDE